MSKLVPPFSGSGLSTQDLTRDQAIAALDVVENTLGAICGCEVCKSGEGKPLPFETELRELLLVEWADGTKEATRRALEIIKAGTGNLTKAEQKKLLKAVKKAIDDGFGKAVEGGLPEIVTAGYKKGKKDVVKRLSAEFVWEQIDKEATAWLHEHHMYWIGGYYDKQVSEFLSATIADGMSQGLGREAIGNQLTEFFEKYPGVKAKPAAYWRGMAANGMNRSRNFGMLQGWDEVGVKELEVLAVMDERTSSICREMNGRIIPVSRGIGQRDMLMAAEDPEDVKTISPWLSLDKIEGKSTKSIMDNGMIMPPYHFHCRTTVVEKL